MYIQLVAPLLEGLRVLPFGNYFIQIIIEQLTINQIKELLNEQISENF